MIAFDKFYFLIESNLNLNKIKGTNNKKVINILDNKNSLKSFNRIMTSPTKQKRILNLFLKFSKNGHNK